MRIYGSFYPFWCLKVLEWFPSLLLLYAVSVNHGEMDDFSAARMILCGIPLDESYLQHRLSFLMKEEKKSLRGKLHVPELLFNGDCWSHWAPWKWSSLCYSVCTLVRCFSLFFMVKNHLSIYEKRRKKPCKKVYKIFQNLYSNSHIYWDFKIFNFLYFYLIFKLHYCKKINSSV